MNLFCIKTLTLTALLLSASVSVAFADDALEIMKKVDDVARNSSDSAVSNIRITTCGYKIVNKAMRCAGKPRVVDLENIQKSYGPEMKDSRSLSIMIKPISDKGIGMLTYEYYDHNTDNDFWLYLPSLGRVKRVVSSDDESGRFFGSEFLNENLVVRKVEDYDYSIVEESTYKGNPVWVIELSPATESAKKLPFGRIVSWIDKERFIPLKENFYNHNNQLLLQQIWLVLEEVDDVWVARKVSMNNVLARRVSHLENVAIKFHIDVPDEILTDRSLTDFAFRERNMERYREQLK